MARAAEDATRIVSRVTAGRRFASRERKARRGTDRCAGPGCRNELVASADDREADGAVERVPREPPRRLAEQAFRDKKKAPRRAPDPTNEDRGYFVLGEDSFDMVELFFIIFL
jgi:hypothetical protein